MPITDKDSAEAWLNRQSDRRFHVAIAARSALRSAPALGFFDSEETDRTVLLAFRAILIAGVAEASQTGEITEAFVAAAHSASSAYFPTEDATVSISELNRASVTRATAAPSDAYAACIHTAISAALAVNSSDSTIYSTDAIGASANSAALATAPFFPARIAAFHACDRDAKRLTPAGGMAPNTKSVFAQPLWPSDAHGDIPAGEPEGLAKGYAKLTAFFDTDPKTWGFWKRWLEGMRAGQPMDWTLQEHIALIPDDIWEAGPKAVADEIQSRTLNWAMSRVRVQEDLSLDDETSRYSAVPLEASNPQRLKRHLDRVEDSLDDTIALGGSNGLTENTVEYRIIKRLVAKYSEDPERVAFDLREVSRGIERQIKAGEYADDEPIRRLQTAALDGVAAISGMEPDIEAELEADQRVDPEKPGSQEVLVLEAAMLISSSLMTRTTAETTDEDAAEILRGEIIDAARETPTDAFLQRIKAYRASVLRRQIKRLAQIARDLSVTETFVRLQDALAVHYDEKASKAAGVIGRYSSVALLFYHAVSILGRMLGLGT